MQNTWLYMELATELATLRPSIDEEEHYRGRVM